MKKLQKNIQIFTTHTGYNVGVVMADDGVALIDLPMYAAEVTAMRSEIAQATQQRIRCVLFTSPDRMTSEAVATLGVPIVVHEAAMAHLRIPVEIAPSSGYDLFNTSNSYEPDILPEMTFTDSTSITLGQKQVIHLDVEHVGGYAQGSCFVTVRDTGILFAGENVAVGQPSALAFGDLPKWSDLLTHLKKSKSTTTLVPGRGVVGAPADVSDTLDFIKSAQSRIKELVRRNKSRSEVAHLVPEFLGAYALKPGKANKHPFDINLLNQLVRAGLERIYDDLKQEQALNV